MLLLTGFAGHRFVVQYYADSGLQALEGAGDEGSASIDFRKVWQHLDIAEKLQGNWRELYSAKALVLLQQHMARLEKRLENLEVAEEDGAVGVGAESEGSIGQDQAAGGTEPASGGPGPAHKMSAAQRAVIENTIKGIEAAPLDGKLWMSLAEMVASEPKSAQKVLGYLKIGFLVSSRSPELAQRRLMLTLEYFPDLDDETVHNLKKDIGLLMSRFTEAVADAYLSWGAQERPDIQKFIVTSVEELGEKEGRRLRRTVKAQQKIFSAGGGGDSPATN